MEVFVPGRLCILGEHTDWAGAHRLSNPNIRPGYCIVCCTNEGLYATVSEYESGFFCFEYRDAQGSMQSIIFPLDADQLAQQASEGGFFSYICGTASWMASLPKMQGGGDDSRGKGIKICNHRQTLPIKKGLSSSAAICTLVAQSFSTHYNLGLTRDEIMDCAFHGEIMTGSMCGRMDQAVAMGKGVGLLQFNGGDNATLSVVPVKSPLYFVVCDLKRGKDTKQILNCLQGAFPHPSTPEHEKFHSYCSNNEDLSAAAIKAIEAGEVQILANCMRAAQAKFDECAIPLCPSELTSPRLHELMAYAPLRAVSLAIKGVGSQGDGSAQVLCSDQASQGQALRILVDELGCEAFLLTVPSSSSSSSS